ncbi:c-type cytochrome [bacterium]|nr:c-type cytochrome [Akkermansiaceae bacterium]MDB4279097.1 c-type cytochrome [bacterium]MDA7629779.1 c-type cytochrome [Akkermansiaceae bacterium]MDA8968445.1 c-type cytochrome [Akkermansiaceae bacterium]MDB4271287.1 c-type cytochrome [Akkermansiaceae bacterium]
MFRYSLITAISLLSFGLTSAKESAFAHFLEPGFPFCEITVDARKLGKGFPKDNLIPRGLVVRVAEDTYVAYDTDLCRMAVAWSGGFLTEESLALKAYHEPLAKKGGGQKILPSPIGTPLAATGLYPGIQLGTEPKLEDPRPAGKAEEEIGRGALPKGQVRWRSVEVIGKHVKIRYDIGETWIEEIPAAFGKKSFRRHFRIGAHPESALSLVLGNGHCEIAGKSSRARLTQREGMQILTLPESTDMQTFTVVQSAQKIERELPWNVPPKDWGNASLLWQNTIKTQGELAENNTDYVLDSIPLPMSNDERRNVRPIDIAFADDYAVVVTFDGDLWKVSGLEGDLKEIEWRRIAGGLHEPSGVRIKGDEIFVFGRNGVTKIIRENGRLVYQNYSSDFWQSAETRDFAHSLDFDSKGQLFISKGGQQNDFPSKHSGRVLKIDHDKKVSVFASGLRNVYFSFRPGTDEIYASDQQGHWVPATPIHRIVKGGYYGFQPAAPWGVPEPEVTSPLCWIPHTIAGSGLGVVWSDQKRFGPLSDSLLYLDYRRPGILRTYLNERDGQAASVLMPTEVDFPLLKGAINPADGQLYVLGFQIFSTNSKPIRGMGRLRYTGKPSVLPTRVIAGKNAVTLTFDQPLDSSVGTVTARRWNYQRSATYGSGHYRPDGKSGEELLPVSEIEFSEDRRSILVATPELSPVHQLAVSYELKTASGQSFSNAAYLTLHSTAPLDLKKEGFPNTDFSKLASTIGKAPEAAAEVAKPTIQRGSVVYKAIGCAACHSIDGTTKGRSGPSWKGLSGSMRELMDGSKVKVTTEYLREAILDPAAKVAKGYNPKDVGMPSYKGIIPDSDIESLLLFIESLEE